MTVAIPQVLKILADPTRLRILALLERQELTVGELARCIAMSPSRVSNHLKILRDNGMLQERREGAFTYCRQDTNGGLPVDLWRAVREGVQRLDDTADDEARLEQVLEARRRRSQTFFDDMAHRWDVIGRDFTRGTARYRALSALIPESLVVADIGCGTGYMSEALARVAEKVICIDHSSGMLERARENLRRFEDRIEMRPGELDRLPLEDSEVDAVFAHMVMHHLADPTQCIAEMRRVLRPGGTVAIVDLLPHRQSWMVEGMGDVKLGWDPLELSRRLSRGEFDSVRTEELEDAYQVQDPSGKTVELAMFALFAKKA